MSSYCIKNVDLFETLINFIPFARYKLILLYLTPLFSFICLQIPCLFVLSTLRSTDESFVQETGLSNYMCTACIAFIVELSHHAFCLLTNNVQIALRLKKNKQNQYIESLIRKLSSETLFCMLSSSEILELRAMYYLK